MSLRKPFTHQQQPECSSRMEPIYYFYLVPDKMSWGSSCSRVSLFCHESAARWPETQCQLRLYTRNTNSNYRTIRSVSCYISCSYFIHCYISYLWWIISFLCPATEMDHPTCDTIIAHMNGDSHQFTFKGNTKHRCSPQTAHVPEQTRFPH